MLQFLLAYSMVVVAPGPIALVTGTFATFHGFRRTVPLIGGIAVGTATLALLMALGAILLASSVSLPIVKFIGAVILAWLALHTARANPPATAKGAAPHKHRAGLFAGGFLISFLAPGSASFFAIAFAGLMLPINALDEAVAAAGAAAILGAGWYAFVALTLSHPTARAAALRHHGWVCRVASLLLAIMALFCILSIFFWN